MMDKKISIIIPVYNAEKYLKRCLDSVMNQTYSNIEIICINDGSKDGSLKILKEYEKKDNRIIIIDKENKGVSAARNDGLRRSTGDYIAFVDADDWVELDMLESLYTTLKEKNVDVVRGNYYKNSNYECNDSIGNLSGIENRRFECTQVDFGEMVIEKLLDGTIPCYMCLLLIKRECLVDYEIYFKENICLMEDTIFYNELMNGITSIYFMDKPIYHYYDNPSSSTKSKDYYIRNIKNLIRVNDSLINTIENGKFYSELRVNIIRHNICSIILEHFFMLYNEYKNDRKKIMTIMNELLDNIELYQLLTCKNIHNLKIHLIITNKLLIKRKYKILFILWEIRKIIRKIKK